MDISWQTLELCVQFAAARGATTLRFLALRRRAISVAPEAVDIWRPDLLVVRATALAGTCSGRQIGVKQTTTQMADGGLDSGLACTGFLFRHVIHTCFQIRS
jgi:hypothetical protein